MSQSYFSVNDLIPKFCPDIGKSKFEPGQLEYTYFDGSLVYLGTPIYTIHWDFIHSDDVRQFWLLYQTMVNNPTPVSITIPDYSNKTWRLTTGYFTMPVGNVTGDMVENFEIQIYNVHELSLRNSGGGLSLWDLAESGGMIDIGSSSYSNQWDF